MMARYGHAMTGRWEVRSPEEEYRYARHEYYARLEERAALR
jgi:hypothetical protein